MVHLPPCHECQSEDLFVHDSHSAYCNACGKHYELILFPEAFSEKGPGATQDERSSLAAGEATCFNHESKVAVSHCEDCGRYLCSLCEVKTDDHVQCLDCFSKASESTHVNRTVRWDQVLLAGALGSFMIWPVIFITAPAVLVMVALKWKSNREVPFPQSRIRLSLAATVAVLQIGFVALVIFGLTQGG